MSAPFTSACLRIFTVSGRLMTLLALALCLSPLGRAEAGTTVAIVKGKDVDRMVAQAVELLGGMGRFVRDGQKVVIKPNLVHQPSVPEHGALPAKRELREEFIADIRIVDALARQMLKTAKCTVTVAEGTPNGADRMFEYLGYPAMAQKLGLKLVDVDKAPRTAVKLGGAAYGSYSLPQVTQQADVLVDVAAMKTHSLTGVTLGMKNLFGLLPVPKSQFHGKVNQVLCDLSRARKPDLVIVDGLVAMEGQGPLGGSPVPMDLLVAGRDVVAVDAVCCAIMGIEPRRIAHLRLAHEQGIGEIDLEKIAVRGLTIAAVRREFKQALVEAEVRIPYDDALVGRLARMARSAEKHWKGGSLMLHFTSGLRTDRRKYPERKAKGFVVRVPQRGDEILFHIPYKVVYEENGRAACEEMAAWIHKKLGEGIRTTSNLRRTPPSY